MNRAGLGDTGPACYMSERSDSDGSETNKHKAIMEQIKVGDILYGMWNYTMHFPVFFRVTKVTAKTAKAVRLGSRMVQPTDGGYGQQGYEVPDKNEVWYDRGESVIRNGKRGLETGSYARYNHYNLEKWDGQPIWADHMD